MPKYKPYPYQQKAIDACWEAFRTDKNVLLRAIMAAGKTCIASCIVEKFMTHPQGKNYRFLFLMDKIDLIGQFAEAFEKFTDIDPLKIGFACAEYSGEINIDNQITIASRQTFFSRRIKSKPANLLIIDEVHGATSPTYQKTIKYMQSINPEMRIQGLTATPFNASGNIYGRPGKLFPKIHYNIEGFDLINHDPPYLIEPRAKVIYDKSLENDLKSVGTVGDDYNNKQVSAVMSKGLHVQNVKTVIDKHCQDRKSIIVIAATIEHAELIKDLLPESEIVHSEMPKKENLEIKSGFKSGEIRLVISVMMMSEGADYPLADCLILARPTRSVRLYLQIIGRIMRTAEGKKDCLFIDLTPSTVSLGVDYDCISIDPKTKQAKKKLTRVICPICDEVFGAGAKICRSCGYAFPEPEKQEIKEDKKPVKLADYEFQKNRIVDVDSIDYQLQPLRGNRKAIKEVFRCDGDSVTKLIFIGEYLPAWWERRSGNRNAPKNVFEFLKRKNELTDQPKKIWIDYNQKYPKVKRSVF